MFYAFRCGVLPTTMLLGTVIVVSLPSRGDDEARAQELKKLQGTWIVVEAKQDGENLKMKGDKMVFKNNLFTIFTKPAEWEGEVLLDPTMSPKRIDLHHRRGMLRDKKWEGIYNLEDGKLTLCYAEGKARPKTFAPQIGSRQILIVLERRKP